MKSRSKYRWLFLIVLLSTSLACSLSGKESKKESSGEKSPVAATAGAGDLLLGEEFRSDEGGFTIRKVKSYKFEEIIGIVNMTALDANPETGPAIMVVGGLNPEDSTNEQLLEKIKKDSSALKFSLPKKIKVSNIPGLSVDVDGSYNDQPVHGQMILAMVTPKQQFTMLALSPAERWKELAPIFEASLGSVSFFEPQPSSAQISPTQQPAATLPAVSPSKVPTLSPTVKPANSQPQTLHQWASSARASSQMGSSNQSASQATGEPNATECGSSPKAWAPLKDNTVDWIELTYSTPVIPTEINIYQSYHPSQIVELMIIATNGDKYIAWAGEPERVENCPDLMTITLELDEKIFINKLRVTVDQSTHKMGRVEIDAVELVGLGSSNQR